jgi:hypothetical protein
MFTIKPKLIGLPKAKRLLEGETLGIFEYPQEFELSSDAIQESLTIAIYISRNKDKGPYEIAFNPPKEGRFEITFSNPSEGNPSGTIAPLQLISIEGYSLGISLLVTVLPNSPCYHLRYQFDEFQTSPLPGGQQ